MGGQRDEGQNFDGPLSMRGPHLEEIAFEFENPNQTAHQPISVFVQNGGLPSLVETTAIARGLCGWALPGSLLLRNGPNDQLRLTGRNQW